MKASSTVLGCVSHLVSHWGINLETESKRKIVKPVYQFIDIELTNKNTTFILKLNILKIKLLHIIFDTMSNPKSFYPGLKSKIILITGAGSGIGASIAQYFASQSCRWDVRATQTAAYIVRNVEMLRCQGNTDSCFYNKRCWDVRVTLTQAAAFIIKDVEMLRC